MSPEGGDAIERDTDKLKEEAHDNSMSFNRAKSKVLHLRQAKPPKNQCSLENKGIKSSPAKKDLGILVDEKLDMSNACCNRTKG